MRSMSAALALLVLAAPAGAQTSEFSRTVDLDSGGALRVAGTKGSMRITSFSRASRSGRGSSRRKTSIMIMANRPSKALRSR